MKDSTILTVSILMILLTAVPGFLDSLPAFIVGSVIGLALVGYFLYNEKPWSGYKASITGVYFSGILALGAGLGVFLILPTAPRYFAAVALIDSIPFIISFVISLKFLRNTLKLSLGSILSTGNGFLALLLFVFIGGIAGRFLANFYELIVVYSGFLIMGILAMMYFRK